MFGATALFCLVAWLCGCQRTPNLPQINERISIEIQHGDLDIALRDIDRFERSCDGKNPACVWSFRILKAQVFAYRREYKKVLAILNPPLPVSLGRSEVAVRKAMFEGVAYRWAQQFEAAEQSFRNAKSLAESFRPHLLPEVLNSLGGLEIDQKKYTEAEATYTRAFSLARQYGLPRQEASALVSLALAQSWLNHFDESIDSNQAGLKLARALDAKDTAAVIYGNLGAGYFALGDFENAKPLFRQAADETGKRKLYDYQAHWLMNLAECYYAERDYSAAEKILQEALAISRPLDEKTALTECLNDLAAVSLETGRLQEAEEYNEEEAGIEKAGLDQSAKFDSQLIRARIASAQKRYGGSEELYAGIIAAKTAQLPLKWEAQARLAKTLDDEGKTAAALSQYRQAIGKIELARKEREHEEQRFSFLSSSIEFYDDYVDFLASHGRIADALKVAELSRARTLVEGLTPEATERKPASAEIRPEQVAAERKQTLLFYWIGRNRSHLWVITPGKTSYFALARASQIAPLVKSYRGALRSLRDARDAGSKEGEQLYTLLVAPAEKVLPRDGRITLLPDPSLASLNFDALIVPGPAPHFWIEDATLTTASSLTLLAEASSRARSHPAAPTRADSLLLVGNTEPVEAFAALPKAHEEMQRVENYFPDARREVLEGKAATPQAYLRADPGRFAYVHFVTHGTASVTKPLDSAVILSRDGNSYKLYAREIVQHPLTARLVTISACEGANGRAYSGEGLIGLSWAFLRAGAHNVVGALWEVNDSAAPQLMDVFYREISRGKDTASALRTAKLALLENQDPEIVFRKPYYWAAFQLYAGS